MCVHSACSSVVFFSCHQLDYLQSRDYFAQIKKLEKSITAEEKEIEKLRDFEKAHLEVCIYHLDLICQLFLFVLPASQFCSSFFILLKCVFCKLKIEGSTCLVTPVDPSVLKISSSNFHIVPTLLCSVQ